MDLAIGGGRATALGSRPLSRLVRREGGIPVAYQRMASTSVFAEQTEPNRHLRRVLPAAVPTADHQRPEQRDPRPVNRVQTPTGVAGATTAGSFDGTNNSLTEHRRIDSGDGSSGWLGC